MRSTSWWRLACLVSLVTACTSSRTEVPVVSLVATGDTLLAPWGTAAAAAWLTDSAFVLVAPQDRIVAVADFGRRTIRPLAQSGTFAQPYDLFRSGDSIWVSDWQKGRTTGWDPSGTLAAEIRPVAALRGALPKARDGLGRWWFEQFPAPGPDGRGNLDSAYVVRTGPDFSQPDTVARLSPLDLAQVVAEGRTRYERRLLSGQDRWGVGSDGSLWIARVGRNRVDRLQPDGKWALGPSLPDQVLPVTQPDRDIFLQQFDEALRPTVEQIPFAAIKPPFETAIAGPDGAVWLVKSRAVGDTLRRYQEVNREGRLVREISHQGLGKAMAVGHGLALVVEPSASGLRLLLYRLPG